MRSTTLLRPASAGLALAAFLAPSLPAQNPDFVFTKLVDSNDLLPGGNGAFFQPNERPTFDGAVTAFWNGQNLNYDSIWSVRPGQAPVRLVDRTTDVPGGTGKFSSFLIDFSQPGYLVLRQGTLIFAGRDSETTAGLYTAGIYSMPANGGAVARVANRNTPFNGGFNAGLQNFSFDAGRVAFHGISGVNATRIEGVYAVDASGANLTTLADSDHPIGSTFGFQVNLFNLPSISAGNVAFYGQTVFDPSTGFNALFTTPATGGFGYGEPMASEVRLPGDPNSNFHTRIGPSRLEGDNLFFSADNTQTNPNFFGLYRVPRTGGAVTRIADRNTALPGITSLLSFQNYAASGSLLAFTARSTTDQYGLYVGNGTSVSKVVASGDAGPFADTLGMVSGVEIGASAYVDGKFVARIFSPFSAYGAYLITPFAQSSELAVTLTADRPDPEIGGFTNLLLNITNNGPATAETPVVRLTLPPGLTFQTATGGGTFQGGGVVVFNLASIPASGTVSAIVFVRLDAPGKLTATAYVNAANADSNRRNNHAYVSVPAPAPRTPNYLIKTIVDTQTPIPDRAGQTFSIFGGNDPLPAIDGGRVLFIAGESNGSAVWTAKADGTGGFARLATTGTEAIPGYPAETFGGFALLRLRNGRAVFYGGNDPRHNGFYAAPAEGGPFQLVVNTSSTRPDRSEPFDFVQSTIVGVLNDGYLTFTAQDTTYAWPVNGGAGLAVVPSGTSFPVGNRASGQFFAAGISGNRLVFGSSRNGVHTAFLDERRYETNAVALVTVSPSDPAGGTFSDRFGGVDDLQVEGATVVFRAFSGANDSIRGIYAVTGSGAPVKLVDTNTPVPAGLGNFSDLQPGGIATSFSLNGGEVVFIGVDGGDQRLGLYSVPATGGAIQKVVAVGDSISPNRVVQGFSQPAIQRNALGQRQVAFRADFFDASTNTGGNGYYVATPSARLINLSTRGRVETGDNVMIGGFVVAGAATKRVIVRALGPSLAPFGVNEPLANPTLEIVNAQGQTVATNDDWRANQAAVQATGLAPGNDLESALVLDLPVGAYTAIVRGAGGTQGVAIVEAFDLTPNSEAGGNARLINVATRARAQTGQNVLIGGLVIGPGPSRRVLIRAIGPALAPFGVANPLANPRVELRNASGQLLFTNEDWQTQSAGAGTPAEITALNLAPTNPVEAALLVTLPPGAYTAIVSGQDGGSGVALVEAYEIP